MDLNYLLHRHQVSIMRAAGTRCMSARAAHEGLIAGYADAIARHQRDHGGTVHLAAQRLLPA